ncbi:MAG: endonuclease III, partial [Candidatus Diapherotrites archaeon]|nr:endonuclease III [Candidatus Diapherotrites archaeon]
MGKDIALILKEMRKAVDAPAIVSSSDPFKVLISTVLSQRTRDSNTERVSKQLFAKYPAAKALASAPLYDIRKLIKQAGFFKVKAVRIKEISRLLIERFDGRVPADLQSLLSLPGVGRKTANCVLVYDFKQPALPVDIHVHRISNRIGLVKTKNPEQTELALAQVVPKIFWGEINHLMVKYGQQICLPRKPRCESCGIRQQ